MVILVLGTNILPTDIMADLASILYKKNALVRYLVSNMTSFDGTDSAMGRELC